MITNSVPINNHIALKRNATLPKTSVQQNRVSNCDALQKQLAFMGGINRPLADTSTIILGKYKKNMGQVNLNGATMLYSKKEGQGANKFSKIILLDNPLPFPTALKKIGDIVRESFSQKCLADDGHIVCSSLYSLYFNIFDKVVSKNPTTRDIKIKGITGQGSYSSAFLTEDNDIFKLSRAPLFPSVENMTDAEIPITQRFVLENKEYRLYGAIEPLAENTELRPTSFAEYQDAWKKLDERLKRKNPDYEFSKCEFDYDEHHQSQLGFIGDTPYLLDHQCIKDRPLVE